MPERRAGDIRPPGLAVWFLHRMLPDDLRGSVLEDLNGRFTALLELADRPRARRWYWQQTLRSVAPAVRDHPLVSAALSAPRRLASLADAVAHELRVALRQIPLYPCFTVIAVLTLAIGVAATVTIFSAADAWMLRPLPYPQSERLVHVFATEPARGTVGVSQSIPDFLALRDQSRTMAVAARYRHAYNLSGEGQPERIEGVRVSYNFFDVLGVQPALGRTFRPGEELYGQHRVCILAAALWRRRFGADESIIGSTILLDAEPHVVVGVLPADFWSWYDGRMSEVWAPLGVIGNEGRGSRFLLSFGRLEAGVSVRKAAAEANSIARRLADAHPDTGQWGAGARPFREQVIGEEGRLGSLVALAGAAFVLLIACANVANLMLTRVAGRDREIAVRRSLGAGRSRILRQLLIEAAVVSILAGLLGTALSLAGVRGLLAVMPAWFPFVDDIGINSRVLVFAVAITALIPVLFGLAPALQVCRTTPGSSLRTVASAGAGGRSDRMRKVFVVAEVGLASALLICSALLVRAFFAARSADYGFNERGLLTFEVALPQSQYPDPGLAGGFYRYLLSSLASLPGVEAVGGAHQLPFQSGSTTGYAIPGHEQVFLPPIASYRIVFPGYFRAMQTPVLRGRSLAPTDLRDSPPVVVVNQALVDRHWPGEDPMGKRLLLWHKTWEIVGVARNTIDSVSEPRATVFVSALQQPATTMSLVVRAAAPESMVESIRDEVSALDPNLPIYSVATMEQLKAVELGGSAVVSKIMGGLAGIALALAMVGVYGVMSYSVSKRTREMGIRMALGARRGDVLGLVVWQGSMLAVIGAIGGAVIGVWMADSLSLLLFGIAPFDLAVVVLAAGALVTAGLVASYIPAWRATRADPLIALRTE